VDDNSTIKVPFFRLGIWKHPQYGELQGTQEKFDAMINNFRRNVAGRPPFIRLGHTNEGAPTFGDTPAEAWVYDIVQEGPVLFALAHPTSDEIVQAIRAKRYRFASPEYQEDYTQKETGAKVGPTLLAIGLTNEPFLTRLPDTVALAERPDDIYLDCCDIETKEVNKVTQAEDNIMKKLADAFNRFLDVLKATPAKDDGGGGMTDAERQKLAEVDTVKTQLAATQEALKLAEGRISTAENTAWSSQVERRLADLVAKGIPPIMCEQVKSILLAYPAAETTMIKLADGKEISQAEQMYATLEAMPEEQRIKMAQLGSQETIDPQSPEAIKKLCEEDVKAMGGKITEDGKYIL